MDSEDYVSEIIYDESGNYQKPSKTGDLYYTIQTLSYLYRSNPEWPETFQDDIKQYVQDCVDLLEKI